ncbi:PREDICTED: putative ribosome-binding factor A, mitochondrial [Nanorana parkeri]|uniref:putative ribosome-binding factor A, mitochondrial n=1 Tax=Nanorana parkeri TaxID=125878 RepID=UPI0008546392|nr:PREDICTED: putative ribosome-binding factor A, mitochondrial [Nanorana parkeri]
MATCSVILPRFRGIVVWREFPCCVRVLCLDPRALCMPLPAPGHCRSVHLSPGLSGKSYLHKFSSKNKKKHWHDSTWQFPVENKPPGLLALIKQQRAEKAENNPRIKALNGILYDAITSLLRTSEVSEEVYDFCIELSKVSVSGDFSVCRAYWLSSGNKDTDDEIDKVLQTSAPRFRHLMISHHVLGNVPPVVFVRDKEDAKRRQVEDLFAVLQSEEDKVSSVETDVSRNLDTESLKEATVIQLPSIFGIDHAELNQQILAYKKKMKAIDVVTDSNEHSQRQKEQLAAIKKQSLLRKKMKTQKWSANDISPQDYLLVSAMDSDRQEELDFELHEDLVEWDEEEETNGGST